MSNNVSLAYIVVNKILSEILTNYSFSDSFSELVSLSVSSSDKLGCNSSLIRFFILVFFV